MESIVLLRNSAKKTVQLLLEPWGEVYDFDSGATVEIRARSPGVSPLEIDIAPEVITVIGGSGSVVEVYSNNKRLEGSGTIGRNPG